MTATSTRIDVTTRHNPLAWLLHFTKPTVLVDGEGGEGKWGTRNVPTTPGRHKVTVFFKYLKRERCGENAITVDVRDGEIARVDFRMPSWMTAKGRMTVR